MHGSVPRALSFAAFVICFNPFDFDIFLNAFWNFSNLGGTVELDFIKKSHNVLILNVQYLTNTMACLLLIKILIGGSNSQSILSITQLIIRDPRFK
jgi:hypothetical protein